METPLEQAVRPQAVPAVSVAVPGAVASTGSGPAALSGFVEAVLFSAGSTVAAGRMALAATQALQLQGVPDAHVTATAVEAAIAELNSVYESTGRAFRAERVAGGYRVMTTAGFAGVVGIFRGAAKESRLSRAAMETLAIVAYRQPITRAELEAIRGVACGEVLRSLLDKRLLAIAGRSEDPGRPMLYSTTRTFLEVFGLSTLKDLPPVGAGAGLHGAPGSVAVSAAKSDAVSQQVCSQAEPDPGPQIVTPPGSFAASDSKGAQP